MKIKITTVFVALQLVVLTAFAQSTNLITGTITDEKGEPLPFATVLLGNGNGVVTDFDGHFSVGIPADEESMEMTASSTGYTPQTALWTKGRLGEPMKLRLKTGIDLPVVVVSYLSSGNRCCCTICCQICSRQEEHPMIQPPPTVDSVENIEPRLNIYPNPFISTLNVEMEVITAQPYLFHLYNEPGLLVFAESRNLEAGLQTFQLDPVQRHLPEGIYFLRISDDAGEVRTKRLVKVSP
ncbi:MAG: carboxypeptidase-like regulatory domain-containing protein [Saprospiraceae bacterium]|nr:carboxypeptidase-like regulatory domain-containing protein [Saprospiraceae bacterium]MCF8250256.1 carboxypeptidase-like regulatory domain-containing protein [Saprospiraceae bacterium]MCF8280916.1 carboxypeptidase-like regulatory domain-containing protein [Bacteroidales bacterium]MCF8312112.1 carboxypeptidase-like regulatory domain-containing protein [Saprospiraceae bacterium]MCF8440519.1 carboxypeptidase-like regulatory domain-containing protein [Saprospiraceae bacterium]